jgi:hypothetical protein
MTRNTVLAGLAATAAAVAVAAPAAQAQVIAPDPTPTPAPFIPPAQPSTPGQISPAQPATPNPTVQFGDCKVAYSRHGYAYAVCSVTADNVPYLQTIDVGYRSNLKTFKPHTRVNWGTQSGTLKITNNMDGENPGAGDFSARVKIAFKDKTPLQVVRTLKFGSTGSNAELIQPMAKVVGA